MRIRFTAIVLCSIMVPAAWAWCQVGQAPLDEVQLSESEAADLDRAILEGRAVPPEQATAGLRQFWSAPDTPCILIGFSDIAPVGPYGGSYYDIRVENHARQGDYKVRAADGVLIGFILPLEDGDTEPQNFDMTAATAIAEQFAAQRYPGFDPSQWRNVRERYRDGNGEWYFRWRKILNAHGALAPWGLIVRVATGSGRVIHYLAPPNRPITGPTVPQVTLAQARQLAAPYAYFDPTLVPFSEAELEVTEDPVGVQGLCWMLYQVPAPTEEDPEPEERWVDVDAINGGVYAPDAFGASGSRRGRKTPAAPKRKRITLRGADGDTVRSVGPAIQGGRTWVRAETLRGVKAWVDADRQGVLIRDGVRRLAGSSVGARFRDYGWWLPLRPVANALGWKLVWRPREREVVVHRPLAPSRASRLP